MRLPRYIDDRLKDAIVSLQYIPGVPTEAVVGYVHRLLIEFVQSVSPSQSPFQFDQVPFVIERRSLFFLTKDGRFRIDVDNQSITFNVTNGYTGWELYRTVIQKCLELLFEGGVINNVSRIGIRYISQFDNVHILDNVHATVRLELPALPEYKRQQARFEFDNNGLHAVLTIVDGYPVQPSVTLSTSDDFFSLLDLDIIHYFDTSQSNSLEDVLQQLEKAHQFEKDLFFQLLEPEFLNTLNPIY